MFVDYVSVHTEARAVHFSHSAGIHQAPAVDQVLFWGYKAINDMIPALFSLWESEKKKTISFNKTTSSMSRHGGDGWTLPPGYHLPLVGFAF